MGAPGRLSENEPVEDCRESDPLGVKQMDGRLGVSDVELTIRGGMVISDCDVEVDDDVDVGAGAVCCWEPTPVLVGGVDEALRNGCRSSS